MYHYSMSDKEVMEMPIRRFWLVVKSVDRILAENEMRDARVALSTNMEKDNLIKYFNSLKLQMGGSPIVTVDDEADIQGIEFLKRMSNKPSFK